MQFFKSLIYEIKSYFVPQRLYWKVEGHCLKCGKCCKNIYSIDIENEKEFKIMKFFHPSYNRFYISHKDDRGNLVFACKYIGEDGLCMVYDKRPSLCKRYPENRIRFKCELPSYCGYKLQQIDFKDYLKE